MHNPGVQKFTWINPADISQGSRIDYIFTTQYMFDKLVKNCDIVTAPAPDHEAVIVTLHAEINKRGVGYWKMNVSILEEESYVKGIIDIIKNCKIQYKHTFNSRQLWDLTKIKIREYSIKYCSQRQRTKLSYITKLENDLKETEDKIKTMTLTETEKRDLLNQKRYVGEILKEQYKEKAKGYQVRSRAKWIAEGERSTRYFLKLEKRHQTFNRIDSLETKNGIKIFNSNQILMEAHTFYSDLYASSKPKHDDIEKYLKSLNIGKKLSHEEKQICEGKISKEECKYAVENLKKNKSPGWDGLPPEFYQQFWEDIQDLILDSFNESFREGELSDTQKLSVLSLIFKKGNRDKLENYRPISLSNYDYKILAFVLAERLQKVVKSIISEDQTGYIRKRYIGNNLREVTDLIEYAEKIEIGGVILFLDFQKAFDSIEWEFLFESLKFYNFGDEFIRWIRTLYTEPVAVIKNNGWLSEKINLQRGIRQGCPVSALLFIIAVEILADSIRTDPKFRGITIKHKNKIKEFKINQFADDANLFLFGPEYIKPTLDILSDYKSVSGLGLNFGKTEALGIGLHKNTQFDTHGLRRAKTPIRSLGMFVGHQKEDCFRLNWENKLEKFQRTLDQWRTRDLTYFGKVQIVKSLAVSQLTYLFTNDIVPKEVVDHINKAIYSFLWGKRERVKRKVLINTTDSGGINMLDLSSYINAIKATWVQRIINSTECNWNFLPRIYLNLLNDNEQFIFLNMNMTTERQLPILSKIPEFYRQIIVSYLNSKSRMQYDIDINDNQIWGNQKFMLKNKKVTETLYFPNWIDSNILYIKDLPIINGKIDTRSIIAKVKNKQNIWSEIFILQNVLSKYIRDVHNPYPTNLNDIHYVHENSNFLTTKQFYHHNIEKEAIPVTLSKWTQKLNEELTDNQINQIFINKVVKIKEMKIAEFNFKILHYILATKSIVSKWDTSVSDTCEICHTKEDILHLIYECNLANRTWKIIEKIFNVPLSKTVVIFGHHSDKKLNYITSFISFTLYKYWLIRNEEKQNRNILDFKQFLKYEVKQKIEVYKLLNDSDILNILQLLSGYTT